MGIRQGLEKVLNEYSTARSQQFKGHPLAHFIRNDLPNTIRDATEGSDRFLFKGSAGQGIWARGPWVGVFNPIVTTSAQSGFYPVYLFREDMAGLYLSLNQAMTEQKNLYKSDAKTVLRAKAQGFRAILGARVKQFTASQINLAPSSTLNDTAFYEAGNILSVFYDINKLPPEAELKNDLGVALELYEALIEGESAIEAEISKEGDEPEQVSFEDATRLRIHKRIERNQKLANAAKAIHGYSCQVCGMNFEEIYGEIGREYIEAHHLEPISTLKGKRVSRNPQKDFAVLCSNCHRMIHKSQFVGDIYSFKQFHFHALIK